MNYYSCEPKVKIKTKNEKASHKIKIESVRKFVTHSTYYGEHSCGCGCKLGRIPGLD